MTGKKWLVGLLFISILLVLAIGLFNYYIDVNGLKSNHNKFSKYICVNTDTLVSKKLNSNAKYFLVGTSRVERINPLLVEKYVGEHTSNASISGSSLEQNTLLVKKIKREKKNFIYGFDAFSLNETTYQEANNQQRLAELHDTIDDDSLFFYLQFDTFIDGMSSLLKDILNMDREAYLHKQDSTDYKLSIDHIKSKLDYENKQKGKLFSNYKAYSNKKVATLAALADKDDMFIIYPKFIAHYVFFQNKQEIEKQYFNAIRTLVNNTEAKVWSFYQKSNITEESKNFDKDGWHFKPMIAKLMFKRIFSKENNNSLNFGLELTKDNIDAYLENLHHDIRKFQEES